MSDDGCWNYEQEDVGENITKHRDAFYIWNSKKERM